MICNNPSPQRQRILEFADICPLLFPKNRRHHLSSSTLIKSSSGVNRRHQIVSTTKSSSERNRRHCYHHSVSISPLLYKIDGIHCARVSTAAATPAAICQLHSSLHSSCIYLSCRSNYFVDDTIPCYGTSRKSSGS